MGENMKYIKHSLKEREKLKERETETSENPGKEIAQRKAKPWKS